MIDPNNLHKAGIIPTIVILGGLFYVGILVIVLLYSFLKYLQKLFR